ncbi:MAG: HAMP domain-containing histidine kinase [Pirellulales bacterium]|nr:HAMP domain-containing histidine kinase [Pirellulales bacterium]
MRWPIRIQLLLPMLTVVVATIALVSALSAFWGAIRARRVQRENMQRVIGTLSEANFPLSEPVLRQMSGLSGAEFLLFDKGYRIRAGTLKLSATEERYLQQECFEAASNSEREQPGMIFRDRAYLSQRITVRDRPPITPGGWLAVLYPEENWTAILWRASYPALLVGAAAICALVLVSMLLAHRFVQPIRRLGDRAAAIAEGNFEPLPAPARNDEIRDLAVSINRMAERLARFESEIRRHEQLRTLGQLGAGLAHQLRNAATGGRMAIELHQLRCFSKEIRGERESLDVALRQLSLMESYLQRFLALGQSRDAPHEPVPLEIPMEDAIELVRPRAVHAGIDLDYNRPTETFVVAGDADDLRQLFVNLLLNAVEAAGGSQDDVKQVEVEMNYSAARSAAVKIRDSGPGPTPEIAERLFEPFATDKAEGTGLGLYVSRQTVEAHRGSIHWWRENGMTCFEVEFPSFSPP